MINNVMIDLLKPEQYYIDINYKQNDLIKYQLPHKFNDHFNKSAHLLALKHLYYRYRIFHQVIYKLPDNIKNNLMFGVYYTELMQKINKKNTIPRQCRHEILSHIIKQRI